MGKQRCQQCDTKAARLCEECAKFAPPEVPWTRWEDGIVPMDDPKFKLAFEGHRVVLNSRFQVAMRSYKTPIGEMLHLSIKRRDKAPIRDWRDLQRIKNELVGPTAEAVEIFPSEDRLVDTANQYHLWCTKPGEKFPFGFHEGRCVMEPQKVSDGSVQRPFEEKPDGTTTQEELDRRLKERVAQQKP